MLRGLQVGPQYFDTVHEARQSMCLCQPNAKRSHVMPIGCRASSSDYHESRRRVGSLARDSGPQR